MNPVGKIHNRIRVVVAAHKSETGDVVAISREYRSKLILGHHDTHVLHQIAAVAALTVIRAIGDVDSESDLVWNLLKDDIVVNELKHQVQSLR